MKPRQNEESAVRSIKHIKHIQPTRTTPPAIFPTKRAIDASRIRLRKSSGTVHKAKLHGCIQIDAELQNGAAAGLVPGAVTHETTLVEDVFTISKIAK
jgi:hypothetical protein